jgi:hypothetical protein
MKIEAIIGKNDEAIMNFEKVITSGSLCWYNYNLVTLSLSLSLSLSLARAHARVHLHTHIHKQIDIPARRYKHAVFGLYRLD